MIDSYPIINQDAVLVVATDGACGPNPGPGGWGWWIDDVRHASGFAPASTNNIMELTAILEALRGTEGPVIVETDSDYAARAITDWAQGWRTRGWVRANNKPVANRSLIEALLREASGRAVAIRWVRGHNGHVGNEQADRLASEAIQRRTGILRSGL